MDLGIFITSGLFAVLLSLVLVWWNSRKRKLAVLKECGIPGPEPSILFGNWGELVMQSWSKRELNLRLLEEWHRRYGRVFGYFTGLTARILVTDLDVLRQVFIKEIGIFTNRPEKILTSASLLASEDERWRYMRRTLTPTFSAGKLKNMIGTMDHSINTLCEIITIYSKAGEEFDVHELAQMLTMEVIMKCALALNIDCQKNEIELVKVIKDSLASSTSLRESFAIAFPWISKIWELIPYFRPRGQGLPFILSHLAHVHRQRKMMRGEKFNDVLELLMEAAEGAHDVELDLEKTKNNSSNISKVGITHEEPLLTDREILENALSFLLAGFETTSKAIAYTIYMMTKHQDVQEKVRVELDNVLGDKKDITYDDVNKMTYMEQVLLETLRVLPPVVLFVTRRCKKDITVKDWTFPKGSVLEAPVWLLHHDSEYWSEPEKFDPDRFGSDNWSKRQQMFYCPFGIGPRNCIGKRFAMLEAKLCIAKLIRKFNFVPSGRFEDPLPIRVVSVGLKPQNGIWMKAELH